MKKLTRSLLVKIVAVCSAVVLLTACGSSNVSQSQSSTSASESASVTQQKTLKVAAIIAGSLGDKGFNDSAAAGLARAKEELGAEIQIIEIPSSDKTKYEPTMMDLADTGDYDIIMGAGNALREVIQQVSVEYPEQKFYLYDASVKYDDGDFPNVYCNTFLQNEASFLGGIVAAGMTTSDRDGINTDKVVGNVLLMDMATINDFMVGFIEGCRWVDPDIKVNTAYIGAVDAAKAKDMSLAMYQQKADIVFQVAASAGLGVIEAAKEQGAYAIGCDSDQAAALMESDPEAANRVLTSVLKRCDNAIFRMLEMLQKDTVPFGTSEALGIQEECVGLAKSEVYQTLVTDEVKAMVEDAEAKIISGEIKVGTAMGATTEELTAIREAVKP